MSASEREELGLRLTCQQVIDFVMSYLDNELPAEDREIFDAHLEICDDCRNYLASYEATKRLTADLSSAEAALPAASVPEELVAAILAAKRLQGP